VSFWDASALVPLVVDEQRTALAKAWQEQDRDMVVWTLTAVEITSALWRLVREGALDDADAREAERIAGDLCERAVMVTDVERVKALAVRLLRVHRLRAADALQLAAALAWADGSPQSRTLLTLDDRLATAAEREGFAVSRAP
jgi:hypothetical protein